MSEHKDEERALVLTTAEVGELLKCESRTVIRWIKEGRIKGIRVGRNWKVPKSEVERILNGE